MGCHDEIGRLARSACPVAEPPCPVWLSSLYGSAAALVGRLEGLSGGFQRREVGLLLAIDVLHLEACGDGEPWVRRIVICGIADAAVRRRTTSLPKSQNQWMRVLV